jgi:carbamoyl-phosphate synthase large subunit
VNATVVISSIGRRNQLIECFRQAGETLGISLRVLGTDASPDSAPAAYLVDSALQVPRCDDAEFVPAMLELCRRERVTLIVPTIDPELPVYAAHRGEFERIGVHVAVSAAETVSIAADKQETNRWLRSNGFPTVAQASPEEVLQDPSAWQFPLILKPRRGSASVGVQRIASAGQLEMASRGKQGLVVEEFAPGDEHTVNVYVNRNGRCLCAIPHRRIEVRGGEVSKAITRKHAEMMELAGQIANALPGAWGALNVQCFLAADGGIRVTEINARFGGGYPLAQQAGANFPAWLIEEAMGKCIETPLDTWQDGLVMLRYDSAVFVSPTVQDRACCQSAVAVAARGC